MDPADMTDEQLQTVIDTGELPAEPASTEEPVAPSTDVPAEQPEEPAVPVKAPQEAETEEEVEKPISRREQLRINDLLRKYPSLKDNEREQPTAPKQPPSDFIKTLDADQEVIDRLEQDRQTYSDQAYAAGLKQMEVREWKRDLKYETPAVLKEFKFLDPKDTENFKPAAAEAMNLKYLRHIGYNPGDAQRGIPESIQYGDVSYREFIEAEMEFVDELATRKAAESTKNIAQQAAATGLRPDGSSAKRLNLNQNPEDMSLEELYAKIGQTPPKKP